MAGLQTLEETVHCTLAAGGSGDLLVREFVWGDRFPEPVAMITHGGAGGGMGGPAVPAGDTVFYYLPEILGSVLALADAAGNVVERYSYDPYGRTAIERHETGGAWTATAASSFGNPFAWTGQRYDAPVRLYHFLFRSYSPTLGRWLQRDPAGYVDGVNLSEGVRSSPLQFTDPLGLETPVAPAPKEQNDRTDNAQCEFIDDYINSGGHVRGENAFKDFFWHDPEAKKRFEEHAAEIEKMLKDMGIHVVVTGLKTADTISNLMLIKALARELAELGIRVVVEGGRQVFYREGKELAGAEVFAIAKSTKSRFILILECDATGKIHGILPKIIPDNWTREIMEHIAEQLRMSIAARKEELLRLGEEAAHRARIGEEEQLLRQILKKLTGS